MKSAFISHSWHDKRVARMIAETLQRLGGEVWLDDAEIKLGDSLIEKIRSGIDSVDYVIALISKKSVTSEWVSRELDVAMNQEIEGRRVKVLPVLVSKCPLPGFLKGKLYADMSSPRAIQRSLPMLLERLEAPTEAIAKARAGKSSKDLSDSSWVAVLRRGLSSGDMTTRYGTLREAKKWRAKDLLTDLGTLDKLFDILDSKDPVYVKLRVFELVQGIEDSKFSYRIEPHLDDPVPQVAAAAIECLAAMESADSAFRILEKLNSYCPPAIRIASLDFFSKVEVRDESTVLSLTTAYDRIIREYPDDIGLRLAGLRALTNQLSSGQAVSIMPYVLSALNTGPDSIRLALIEVIFERGENFWIPNAPNLRTDLYRAIIECSKSNAPQVAAASLIALLLLPEISSVLPDRNAMWDMIAEVDGETLSCWLDRLDNYRIEAVFDQEEDVTGIAAISEAFGGRFKEEACEILCQIGGSMALHLVNKAEYKPKGWSKHSVLRALAKLDPWDPELSGLFEEAGRDLPGYVGGMGDAWKLFIQLRVGAIDIKTFDERFPKDFNRNASRADEDEASLASLIEAIIGKTSQTSDRRRLQNVLKKLRA